MKKTKASKNGKFTTIKVRDELRRWLKVRAAESNVPMYELVEKMIAKSQKGRPWEQVST